MFKVEEPRSKLRGFSIGKEFVNYIARLDPAASSGDCGEHSVQSNHCLCRFRILSDFLNAHVPYAQWS